MKVSLKVLAMRKKVIPLSLPAGSIDSPSTMGVKKVGSTGCFLISFIVKSAAAEYNKSFSYDEKLSKGIGMGM